MPIWFTTFIAGLDATWVQNLILAIGLSLTLMTIRSQYAIARKQSTLQKIEAFRSDTKYQDALQKINLMRQQKIDPAGLNTVMRDTRRTQTDRDEARDRLLACNYVLGTFDLFAMGIRLHIIDDHIFKAYYYSTYIEIAEFLRTFISSRRDLAKQQIESKKYVSHETIYQDTLWLLQRWKDAPLQEIGRSTWHPFGR